MGSLQKIIRKKYLACIDNLKKSDLVTDEEYNVVSGCRLSELLQIESTPSILDQICEGEKWQATEYYAQQEKKYHIHVAKIYRKPRVKPALPRIVEVEVAIPAPAVSDNVQENAAIPAPYEPTDALRESPDAASNGQPRDPYQMVEEPLQLEQPLVLSACDDHFGSKEVDGTRDFLEICTGTNFPPMTLADPSAQQLLLAELGIPERPLNNNFQEIDLRGIGTPVFKNPLKSSTPFVETGVRRTEQLFADLEQNVPPTTNMSEHAQLLSNQQPEEARSESAMPTSMGLAQNTVPNGEPSRQQETIQAAQSGEPVAPERSSSSVSPVVVPPPNPRSRRSPNLTMHLPPMVDILPRPRRSFDIFSYHHQSNLYPMIEYVQSQLFLQQAEPQLQHQPLVEASLVTRAAGEQNAAARDQSTMHESTDQASRDPFVIPAVETSNNGRLAHFVEPLQLSDQTQPLGGLTNVPMMTTLASLDAPLTETLEPIILPSLVATNQNDTLVNEANAAKDALIGPGRQGEEAAVGMGTVTRQNGHIWEQAFNPAVLNPETTADLARGDTATPGKIDSMLLDILILVQGEMCQHRSTDAFFVPMTRLKELLNVRARLDVAKIVKNIILLKQVRLLDVSCAADNSIAGVGLKLPAIRLPETEAN